jgi:hypothetical protein
MSEPLDAAKQTRPLAWVALSFAIAGLVLGAIPFVTWFAWPFGLTGLILSIIALARKGDRKTVPLIGLITAVIGWIVAIAVSLASFAIVAASSSSSSSTSFEQDQPSAVAAPEIPSGYTDGGEGLAWKWGSGDCSDSISGCNPVDVFAYEDCSSGVYLEANILDRSGAVIGYTNDSLGSLAKGQRGKMKLKIYEDGADKVQITSSKCY